MESNSSRVFILGIDDAEIVYDSDRGLIVSAVVDHQHPSSLWGSHDAGQGER